MNAKNVEYGLTVRLHLRRTDDGVDVIYRPMNLQQVGAHLACIRRRSGGYFITSDYDDVRWRAVFKSEEAAIEYLLSLMLEYGVFRTDRKMTALPQPSGLPQYQESIVGLPPAMVNLEEVDAFGVQQLEPLHAYVRTLGDLLAKHNTADVRRITREGVVQRVKVMSFIDDVFVVCDGRNNAPDAIADGKGRVDVFVTVSGREYLVSNAEPHVTPGTYSVRHLVPNPCSDPAEQGASS